MGYFLRKEVAVLHHDVFHFPLLALVVVVVAASEVAFQGKPSAEGNDRKMASHLSLALSHLLRSPFFLLFSLSLLAYLVVRALRVTGNSRRAIEAASPPGTTGLPLIGETPAFLAANHSGRGVYDFVRARHLR